MSKSRDGTGSRRVHRKPAVRAGLSATSVLVFITMSGVLGCWKQRPDLPEDRAAVDVVGVARWGVNQRICGQAQVQGQVEVIDGQGWELGSPIPSTVYLSVPFVVPLRSARRAA